MKTAIFFGTSCDGRSVCSSKVAVGVTSLELRWFLDGAYVGIARDFEVWFEEAMPEPLEREAPRTDVYVIENRADVGIKQRGGEGLEIKCMVVPELLRPTFGGTQASGQLWSKVGASALRLPEEPACVVHARKSRAVRRLGGCNVEWTRIEIAERNVAAWSFGFEAYVADGGADVIARLTGALDAALRAVTASSAVPDVTEPWRELSYPAWLISRTRERR